MFMCPLGWSTALSWRRGESFRSFQLIHYLVVLRCKKMRISVLCLTQERSSLRFYAHVAQGLNPNR